MNKIILAFLMVLSWIFASDLKAQKHPQKILLFYKTAAYKHASIPAGIAAITKLGKEFKFQTDTSSDASLFTVESLKKYDAVVFLSTSGDMLDSVQQRSFENYIHAGGGYMGIHGASAGGYNWPWYGKLVGAIFNGHPVQQFATFNVLDRKNRSTRHLPKKWNIKEELYNFKSIGNDIRVLISVDESTYKGGTNGSFHPMAWYREFEGGRSFYTALGHADEKYTDPLFLKHILEGIRYAMGRKRFTS
ncbi:MAG TPA: ThuA domain-containing protein [Daejeonella sp.]|uniref:ThuA domain-containing protein n=1 Tax=Daejeonella sp. TaxID=2805397 RepID=UPI002ED8EAF2